MCIRDRQPSSAHPSSEELFTDIVATSDRRLLGSGHRRRRRGASKPDCPAEPDESVPDEQKYAPILRFDRKAKCYPDTPTLANDGSCADFHENAPLLWQTRNCSGSTVYQYWHWYGHQKGCLFHLGEHGNDWERVNVHVTDGEVTRVVFYQHSGHYARTTFQSCGTRPVVYVGKLAHGSYHAGCRAKQPANHAKVGYCGGGCGYWDDFRNPGRALNSPTLIPLHAGQTIDGIKRRGNEDICQTDCKGSHHRPLTTSGCWQHQD
eukprot:TRINITY_DN17235_c0_g1_i1.p1 TRINITY_DN17235_c0_g1~~TRINITY_DN17235_c0_g1_i1.p1  ORF type:complete len:263 (-),score=40.56 TRINITY_DN17235_c0_g1_i1:35-823(-)